MTTQSEREAVTAVLDDMFQPGRQNTLGEIADAAIAALDAHRSQQRTGDDEIVEAMCRVAGWDATRWHQMRRALAVARRMDGSARDGERLARECEIHRHEAERHRQMFDRAIETLTRIHMLLIPSPVTVGDKTFSFNPQDKSLWWDAYRLLGERIRAIPESIDAAMRGEAGDE